MKTASLGIVVPCYNEQEVIQKTVSTLLLKLDELVDQGLITPSSFISLIDDGSQDKTWTIIQSLSKTDSRIKGIKFSRNFGHQMALLSGLLDIHKQVDVIVTIDADLQHDISVLGDMLKRLQQGAHIVYGVRNNRNSTSFLKNKLSTLYYALLDTFGVSLIRDHADYRMCRSVVIEELARFNEVHIYLRGIFPSLGYNYDIVQFEEQAREAGETKYSFGKMLGLALNGITSFSSVPLRVITWLGVVIFLFSIMSALYAVTIWFTGQTVRGWASTLVLVSFFGGIQLLSIGVLGEYIGRIYQEVKRRPRFIIEDRV